MRSVAKQDVTKQDDEETTKFQRAKESLSQLLCVVFVDGDADEMLSSYAWRTKSTKLIAWLDWMLGSGHCEASYLWEKQHYKVKRFD